MLKVPSLNITADGKSGPQCLMGTMHLNVSLLRLKDKETTTLKQLEGSLG